MIFSNVKLLMLEKNVSIQQIVRETGLSSTTVQRARGELIRECRLSTLETIAGALDCYVKDLFGEEQRPPRRRKPAEEGATTPTGFPLAELAPYVSSAELERLRDSYAARPGGNIPPGAAPSL